jgi:hypothetical protein
MLRYLRSSFLFSVGWHAAEYLIGSAFAARQELADIVFLPTGFTGTKTLILNRLGTLTL